MKKFTLSLDINIWVTDIEIEAENEEDAINKLNEMSAEDIVNNGYVKNHGVDDITIDDVEDDEDEE